MMTIPVWKTRTPFESMVSWFDHDFVANDFEKSFRQSTKIQKKQKTYVIKADMHGLKKKDIHLELKNGMLTLRGELHGRNEKTSDRYHRTERTFGSFERKFRIPEGVTEKDIHAKFTNGVLELTIPAPKADEAKAIEIKVE